MNISELILVASVQIYALYTAADARMLNYKVTVIRNGLHRLVRKPTSLLLMKLKILWAQKWYRYLIIVKTDLSRIK